MNRRHDLFCLCYRDTAWEGGIPPHDAKDTGQYLQGRGPGMSGPCGVFLRQRHVDLILDGKAVDRQLCHRYGQPLGKCAAVEP